MGLRGSWQSKDALQGLEAMQEGEMEQRGRVLRFELGRSREPKCSQFGSLLGETGISIAHCIYQSNLCGGPRSAAYRR